MKTTLFKIGIVFFSLFLLFACGGGEEEASGSAQAIEGEGPYVDGTYSGTYDHFDSHGWKPQLQITIQNGNISRVGFDYVNTQGQQKSQDASYAERMEPRAGTTPAEAFDEMERRLADRQEAGIDAVSGATHSTENFNALAEEVLENARNGNSNDVVLPMNGTYTAEGEFGDHGWKPTLSITFQDGEITDVTYDEVNEDGDSKRESEDYAERYSEQSGLTPDDAFSQLEEQLMNTGDADDVDAVSGATSSSENFKSLARQIIESRG
ncbi:MAG: FMN-binding protein [Spirochaetia bacterium]